MKHLARHIFAAGALIAGACSFDSLPSGPGVAGAAAPPVAGTASMPPASPSPAGAAAPPAAGMPAPSSPLTAAAGAKAPMPSAAGAGGADRPPTAAGSMAVASPRQMDLDPNARFDWEQTAPGKEDAKSCRAGLYEGGTQYSCMMVDAGFGDLGMGFGADLTGVISIALAESANGEFLEISDGEFSSISIDVFGLQAVLRGDLDCETLKFSAKTENGVWGVGDPNAGILELGTFEAELTGMLDPATGTLSGTWTITGSVPFVCMGPWSATLAP